MDSNEPDASISSRAASVSAAEPASAAATNRWIIRSRWAAPRATVRAGGPERPGDGAIVDRSTSPATIARAASEAVQPESTSVRIATSTRIVVVVVEAIAGRRAGRLDDAVAPLPGADQGRPDARSRRRLLDCVHGLSNVSSAPVGRPLHEWHHGRR